MTLNVIMSVGGRRCNVITFPFSILRILAVTVLFLTAFLRVSICRKPPLTGGRITADHSLRGVVMHNILWFALIKDTTSCILLVIPFPLYEPDRGCFFRFQKRC